MDQIYQVQKNSFNQSGVPIDQTQVLVQNGLQNKLRNEQQKQSYMFKTQQSKQEHNQQGQEQKNYLNKIGSGQAYAAIQALSNKNQLSTQNNNQVAIQNNNQLAIQNKNKLGFNKNVNEDVVVNVPNTFKFQQNSRPNSDAQYPNQHKNMYQSQSQKYNFIQNDQHQLNQLRMDYIQPSNQNFMSYQQQQLSMQNYQPGLTCREHDNSPIIMICFSPKCQEYSRLVCTFCIRKKSHFEHIDQTIPSENIEKLQLDSFLNGIGTISQQLQEIQQQGIDFMQENSVDIQNQLEIVEKEFHNKYKEIFKSILQSVGANNDNMQEQMGSIQKQITDGYGAQRLIEAIQNYIQSPQGQVERTQLEQTLGSYATIYNSEQLLKDKLPKKKLKVDMSKLEQVQDKLREALMILSEVAITVEDLQIQFEPSAHSSSSKYIKVSNNGSRIMCTSSETAMIAITTAPLLSNQMYMIEFKVVEGDIGSHYCWGAMLIKEKFKNATQGLFWPNKEQGVYCCFDGDCYQTSNALISENNVSQKLKDTTFYIEFNQSQKIFRITSKDGIFKCSLKEPQLIEDNVKYYLGLALGNCKVSVNVIQ